MMKLIRAILGSLILLLDRIFKPKSLVRPPEYQKRVDEQTRNLSLYQFQGCPFCVKVRRSMRQMALDIELRDAQNDQAIRKELLEKGGMLQVPCLKIEGAGLETQWLYESSDIIRYLKGRFAE